MTTEAAAASSASRVQQPPWSIPVPTVPEPQLCVYNSLTRTKTPFVAQKGRHVTWYNCGPTVYDASHMGHARNYVSQDILRRIVLFLGYDVHFVMNITDVDDKIIVRARQEHLVREFRAQHPHVTTALLAEVKASWATFLNKTVKKFAPPAPGGAEVEDEAAWEEISRLAAAPDGKWKADVSLQEPKFGMWFAALDRARQAILAGSMAAAAASSSSSPASSADLIDACADILAPALDAAQGHTISDPAIFRALAAKWETAFFDDMRRLNVLPPSQLTRVSEYVPEIVDFIQKIVDNGFAYADERGNVWFDTKRFDGAKETQGEGEFSYAKLAPWSKGNRELLEEGEGSLSTSNATTAGKRSASDFALWKSSKPGEPSWPSVWGQGRPGWHIECSVMASEVLGSRIDVHSGGVDLMFPHHDNELAQSEAHHGCAPWINYFLHTGHLHIEGLKMSKSLKNFISIDEALARFSARQLRLAFLLQLWSSKMDFSESAMQDVAKAEKQFDRFFLTVKTHMRTHPAAKDPGFSDGKHHYGPPEKALIAQLTEAQLAFRQALADSFDTPTAMRVLQNLVSAANVYEKDARGAELNAGVLSTVAEWVGEMLRMLGLGAGPSSGEAEIGWGEADAGAGAGSAGTTTTADREATVLPYLEVLSSFRSSVRALARANPQDLAAQLLKLADKVRDEDLVDLGVALEDLAGAGASAGGAGAAAAGAPAGDASAGAGSSASTSAILKFVPAAQLRAERDAKLAAASEKAARKAAAAEAAARLRAEKLARGRVPPGRMFLPVSQGGLAGEGEWSEWDERGIPTKVGGEAAEEVSKKKRKALEKEWAKQGELHAEWLAAKERGEVQ